jgi:hypothetical protein
MGLRDLMQGLGFWTDVFKWSEPSIVRVRLRGDWWLRLAIALGAGGVGTCLLLVLFAINQRPPHPVFGLIGGAIAFVIAASFLFHGGSSASGRVRVCQEGIQRKRNYVGVGAQMFEEANWPYESIEQCVIVPGQAIGKPFSVLLVGGGGEWELIGVPRKIDLQQLANFLGSRRVAVSSANFLPGEFMRPINLPVSLGLAGLGLTFLLGGLVFYAVKTAGPPGANVAQAPPANPVQVQPQAPEAGPPPPPAARNERAAANQAIPPPEAAPVNPPADVPAIPDRPRPSFQGLENVAVPPSPPAELQPAPGPAIPERPAAAPAPVKAAGDVVGRDTEIAGGKGGFPFRSGSKAQEPLIGFAWSSGSWAGQKLIGRLEPMFTRDVPRGFQASVVAREGYAVGGISVEGDDFVRAIQVVFMRTTADGKLEPADSYASEWIGHPAGKSVTAIDSRGTKVIGIQGRKAAILDAVGLVLADGG